MNSIELAALCRRVRWTGVPLLAVGVLLLIVGIFSAATGSPWTLIPHGLVSSGLALAAFGANHDASIALAWAAQAGGKALPGPIADELEAELRRDRAGVMSLHASPRVALALPVVVLVIQAWLAWRLFG